MSLSIVNDAVKSLEMHLSFPNTQRKSLSLNTELALRLSQGGLYGFLSEE